GALGLLHDGSKACLVAHSHISQHLAIQFDRSLLQASDEHAVRQTMFTGRSVDTRDPQCTEGALLVATVTVGILACTHDRLLGDTEHITAAATITLGGGDDFLMAGAC